MIHIDEQISQIYNFLSPFHSSLTNNPSPVSHSAEPLLSLVQPPPQRPPSLSITTIASPSEPNTMSFNLSPDFAEKTSFYSDKNETIPFVDTNQSSSTMNNVRDVSRQSSNDQESIALSIPPPPSIYNRAAGSSMVSLGISTIPRGSVSNKIVPAPQSTSPKQPLNTSFRPVSNTRYNPGRSPKPKTRSHQNRSNIKHQQQSAEKSTIIELESPSQQDATNKTVPLLSSSVSSTKSGSNIFRRFMAGGNNTEKTGMSSTTLLYPPTSDDEHPMSPASSGNDDDDYRPLTLSSNKYHHTPL